MAVKVFIVEDNIMYAEAIKQALKNDGYELRVYHSGREFLDDLFREPNIVILDYALPDVTGLDLLKRTKERYSKAIAIIVSGQEDVNVVVDAYHHGARHYIIKNENALIDLRNAVKNFASTVRLTEEVELLREELEDRSKYANIIGESTAINNVLKLIQRVEKTDTLAMITGDSGTGKELVAEAIHKNSKRAKKPFVAVNVAAIPTHLLEDELFGHEKGAFTGASSRRKGKFEEANNGTIFLDEIGEMELNLQAKLLRVLQDGTISRLGSNKVIKLDVRIIAATNRNLGDLVKQGKFREDLYYRIQGFLIHLPRLRDRGNDVIVLAKHFLDKISAKYGKPTKTMDESAREALLDHPWTGNVRELMAVMERCVLMTDNEVLTDKDLIFSDVV